MIYQDVYIEIGPSYKFGIGKTTPTEDIHIGGNMHLNNPRNITYNSGFKITVNNSPLAFIPIGTIVLWPVPNNATIINPMTDDDASYAGPNYSCLPYGWVFCEGLSLLRTQFPTLFTMIGTLYGSTSGSFFNIPNFKDNGYGIVNRDVGNTTRQLNNKYIRPSADGTINSFTLTAGHLPQHRHFGKSSETNGADNHRHSQTIHDWNRNGGGSGGTTSPDKLSGTTDPTILNHNHSGITGTNMNPTPANSSINLEQPYICLRYIIRIF
jgi:microcystin-dependent protein